MISFISISRSFRRWNSHREGNLLMWQTQWEWENGSHEDPFINVSITLNVGWESFIILRNVCGSKTNKPFKFIRSCFRLIKADLLWFARIFFNKLIFNLRVWKPKISCSVSFSIRLSWDERFTPAEIASLSTKRSLLTESVAIWKVSGPRLIKENFFFLY